MLTFSPISFVSVKEIGLHVTYKEPDGEGYSIFSFNFYTKFRVPAMKRQRRLYKGDSPIWRQFWFYW